MQLVGAIDLFQLYNVDIYIGFFSYFNGFTSVESYLRRREGASRSVEKTGAYFCRHRNR